MLSPAGASTTLARARQRGEPRRDRELAVVALERGAAGEPALRPSHTGVPASATSAPTPSAGSSRTTALRCAAAGWVATTPTSAATGIAHISRHSGRPRPVSS